MSENSTQSDEHFDFLRNMWGNAGGVGLPNMMTPTLDEQELATQIKNLKAVEGWLKMNLDMLQMTIQGLEIQRSTLSTIKAMAQAHDASGDLSKESLASLFSNPALWAWPFGGATPAKEAGAPAAASTKKPRSRKAKPSSPA